MIKHVFLCKSLRGKNTIKSYCFNETTCWDTVTFWWLFSLQIQLCFQFSELIQIFIFLCKIKQSKYFRLIHPFRSFCFKNIFNYKLCLKLLRTRLFQIKTTFCFFPYSVDYLLYSVNNVF